MFSSARSGRVLSRSLRITSSKPLFALLAQPCRQLPLARSTPLIPSNSRLFSVFPKFSQQAVAEKEVGSHGGPSEFTEFSELAEHGIVDAKIVDTITKQMKIHTMTDVQRMTINECLDGADVIAQARTGTGKTLAFLIPIVQRLLRSTPTLVEPRRGPRPNAGDIRALIISPTRELAEQIAVEAKRLVSGTDIRVQTAVGGTQKDVHLRDMRRNGCHILVGTPGRIADILSDSYTGINLDNLETFVLDEADRLLDIGFAPKIEEIQNFMPAGPEANRQTLMFSATVPKSVVGLVRQTLQPDFKFIRTVDPNEPPTHARVPQNVVYLPGMENQIPVIVEIATNAMEEYNRDPANTMPFKAIAFFASLNEVEMAYETLRNMSEPGQQSRGRNMFSSHPLAPCKIIQMSSRLTQGMRSKNSEMFRNAECALLISSDVTARGMDFPNVTHVIQIGLPGKSDDYVHRLGRTGRAGKPGQGWLLLNRGDEAELSDRARDQGLTLNVDTTLETAKLDMTRPTQLPAHTARIMQLVESGVKTIQFPLKRQTYTSFFGVLAQQNAHRSKQANVDMMNQLAIFGWGLEKPPGVNSALMQKMGYTKCQNLEYDDRELYPTSREGRSRDSNRRRFDSNDPFGTGLDSGRGTSRPSFGDRGGSRSGFGDRGSSRSGFGDRGDRGGRGPRGGRDDRSDRFSRDDRGDRGGRGDRFDRPSRDNQRDLFGNGPFQRD